MGPLGEVKPTTPPYLASLAIYRRWMRLRLDGMDDAVAWRCIADELPQSARRHFSRGLIAGAHSQGALTLSVPIAGGASVTRRLDPALWRLSMHGRWPEVHIGALMTSYASTPFYPHMRPAVEDVIGSAAEGERFAAMSAALHTIILRTLSCEELIPALRRLAATDPLRLSRLAHQHSAGLDAELAFIDAVARKGPAAIFSLLAPDAPEI